MQAGIPLAVGRVNTVKLSGEYKFSVSRAGRILVAGRGKNLVTNAGENLVADRVDPATALAAPSYIALGSGSAIVLKTDTILSSEIASTRTLYSASAVASNQLSLDFSLTATAPWAMREAGIFNAVSSGVMFSRFLTQAIDLGIGDILAVTWILTFSGVE